MSERNDNETLDQTAVDYVLGELDDAALQAFEQRLASDAALKAEVTLLRESYEGMAHSVARNPPPALKARVLDTVHPAAQTSARWTPPWSSFAVAAACLIAVYFASDAYQLRQRVSLERAVGQMLLEPNIVKTFTLQSEGDAVALVSLDLDSERGAIAARALPGLQEGEVFRLWAEVGDKTVHCADFHAGRDLAAYPFAVPVDSYDAPVKRLFVTRERAPEPGQEKQPKGPVVLSTLPT